MQEQEVIDKGMQEMSKKFGKVGEVYVDPSGLSKSLG